MNSKQKGNIALGECIKYLTSQGYIISIPLNDAQDYDLIADMEEELKTIQVKYTSTKQTSGNYYVDTRTRGHNNYVKEKDKEADYYFITTELLENYFIPYDIIKGKQSFTLNDSLKDYLIK